MDLQKTEIPSELHFDGEIAKRKEAIQSYVGRLKDPPELEGRATSFSILAGLGFFATIGGAISIIAALCDHRVGTSFAATSGTLIVFCFSKFLADRSCRIDAQCKRLREHVFSTLAFIDTHADESSALKSRIAMYLASKQSLEGLKSGLGATESTVMAEQALEEVRANLTSHVSDFLLRLDQAAEADKPIMAYFDRIEMLRMLVQSSDGAIGARYRETKHVSLDLAASEMHDRLLEEAQSLGIDPKLLPAIGS